LRQQPQHNIEAHENLCLFSDNFYTLQQGSNSPEKPQAFSCKILKLPIPLYLCRIFLNFSNKKVFYKSKIYLTMNWKSFFCIILLALLVGISSCKKNEPIFIDQVVLGQWIYTDIFSVNEGVSIIQDCQKDDVIDFRIGGLLVIDNGEERCTQDEPDTTQGFYSLGTDGNIALMNFNGIEGALLTINNDTIVFEYNSSGNAPIRITFARKP